jgi:hypothetical protein
MAASPRKAFEAPEFPYWPFNCLSLYAHMARDVGAYAQAMTGCTDAMEAARVEGDLGVRLFADLMQGYFDLTLAPWTAMVSVMAEASEAQTSAKAAVPQTRARAVH